ncbi:hypothetical protein [Nakamurella flava]|uniref:hypothetical protein n=1 Tax=Nakamurella flava TaxID=2576308 RepID=UPI00140BC3D6|nr:hypothetical protein [Nakamurella flava]
MPLLRDPHHLHRHYALPGHLRVVERGPDAVQIGIDPPARVVLRGAPAHAAQVLRNLTGHRPLADVLATFADDPSDVAVWVDLVAELSALGLVVEVPPGTAAPASDQQGSPQRSAPRDPESVESASLTTRLGAPTARRVVRSRADSRITLLGPPTVHGPLRTILLQAGLGSVVLDATAGAAHRRRGRPPAADLVVLGAIDVLDLGLAATLTRDRVPHLGVVAGIGRVVVGPLVLPGRTSCLACAHRHRVDADPEWPTVLRSLLDRRSPTPAAVTVAMATALAAAQILDHVDHLRCPGTVDGTLEWNVGEATPRRRTWVPHPTCGCRDLLDPPANATRFAGADGATVTMER